MQHSEYSGILVPQGWHYQLVDGEPLLHPARGGVPLGDASRLISMHIAEAPAYPSALSPDLFDGALASLAIEIEGELKVLGTAVLIAPGLAVTARHVVTDAFSTDLNEPGPQIGEGRHSVFCFAPRKDGTMDYFKVRSVTISPNDVAFVGLQLRSSIGPSWLVHAVPVTSRWPQIGEGLSVFGCRHSPEHVVQAELLPAGTLYGTRGNISELYLEHNAGLAVAPAIQLECETYGGMSGGAVLDDFGHLVGVVSSGYEMQPPLSFVSWLAPSLDRTLILPWPPELYDQPTHVLDISDEHLKLHGRDKIIILPNEDGSRTTRVEEWNWAEAEDGT